MSALSVGVVADTHGELGGDVIRALEGVDLILHAGDIGGGELLDRLRGLAPVVAVVGNGDPELVDRYPWEQRVEFGGARILLCHWYDNFGRIHPRVQRELDAWHPDVLVYGHTHEARNERIDGRLHFNPGYAGPVSSRPPANHRPAPHRARRDSGRDPPARQLGTSARCHVVWLGWPGNPGRQGFLDFVVVRIPARCRGHGFAAERLLLKTYARLVTRHPAATLVLVLLVSILAVTRIVDLRGGPPRLFLDPAVDAMLPTEDEGRTFYDRIREIFGSDESLILAIHDEQGIFRPQTLRAIQRIGERVSELEGIRRVVSLATAPHLRSVDGDIDIAPLFETVPESPERLAGLREEAIASPLFRGTLISEDGRTSGMVIHLSGLPEIEFTEKEIDLRIKEMAREELGGVGMAWLTGGPHVKAQTARFLLRDLSVIIPLCFVVMALISLISFRSARGVAIPILTIAMALLWTLAAVADLGQSLNLVTTAVPVLVLVIGFAYAIHVVSAYYEAVDHPDEGEAQTPAAYRGLLHVALPTLLTGATTAAGFLAITTSTLPAIREFGLYCTIGVVATMLVSLTFAPALLSLLPEPDPRGPRVEGGPIDRMLSGLADFNVANRGAILIAGGLVAALAVAGMTRIRISTDFVSNFAEDSDLRQAFEAVSEHLSGASELVVALEFDTRDAWKEPANLAQLEELQTWLVDQPEIHISSSLVDVLKVINRSFHGDAPEFDRIPTSKRLVSQLLFFGGGDQIARHVDTRFQLAMVRVRTSAVDSGAIVELVSRIEGRLAEMPRQVRGRVTGNTVLVAKTIDDIAYGQALSLSTAFVVIYAILTLLFMSFRVGFIALIPNALPVLVYFGVLGWSGISLNATTGLVACLVLGIAVDDTIHFFARFNAVSKERADEAAGVREAMLQVGRPVTYTSIALVLGFSLMLFSSLKNQAEFGALAAFTLGFAWLVDMTFTPALAARLKVVTIWDVIGLDLGEDPQRAIPLLHGLSTAQARIAVLMTDLVELPAGGRLIEAGQASDGMYVVIDGELVSHVQRGGARVDLNAHGRGDALGEVGLLHGVRTATVDCKTASRLMYFEPEDMERLRRRYPRIAAQVLHNLSTILAARLAKATERVDA